jgi:threonine dehydratase
MIDIKDIMEARKRISAFVHKTPLIYSLSFSRMTGSEVYLKAENLQKTGSFKVRGAFNRLGTLDSANVIAASMGNHAQGVAFAAAALRKRATIVMPLNAPLVKQEATKGYGAEVILHGENFDEALDFALSRKDMTFVHAFDDEAVIAGQGTVALEILEDLKDIDFVIVPIGGGGLAAGISLAFKDLSPKTQVIGVQTSSAPAAHASFKEEVITTIPPLPTLADGIAVGRVGEKTFRIISRNVDDMVLVDEGSIAMAILLFLERKKLVVEGAGAVPLAALMADGPRYNNKRVVLVVSGGNIDFALIDRIIRKGLVSSSRIVVFDVQVDDAPGRLHSLTGIIASHSANILDVVHDRLSLDLPVGKTRVVFTVETRGSGHFEEILADLTQKGFKVKKRKGC